MKKLLTLLVLSLVAVLSTICFVACDIGGGKNSGGSVDVDETQPTDASYFNFTLLDDGTYEIKAKDKNNLPTEIVLPSTYNGKPVTSIGDYAFYNCSSLTEITIPDSVTSIGSSAINGLNSAFYGCNNLQYNEYDNGLYLGNKNNPYVVLVKAKSTDITSCIINDKTRFIDSSAFRYCSSLTEITIPDSVTSIGYDAFLDCSSLEKVTIGNGVKSILGGDVCVFNGCPCVRTINGVSYVDKWVVNWDWVTTNVYIQEGTVGIADLTFAGWDGLFATYSYLESITIPDSVKVIGKGAFNKNDKLSELSIPNGVKYIGNKAFTRCIELTNITIGSGVESIGEEVFRGCYRLANINVNNNNKNYKSIDGNLYSKDGKTLIQYAVGKNATEFTISETVTNIGNNAFFSCSKLTSVTIGSGVKDIGEYAFYGCSKLTSVIIPEAVTSIGDYAFYDCESLTEITIGNSVTSIGDYAFYGYKELYEITIPDSVISIGSYAFSGGTNAYGKDVYTRLTNVTIGKGVESIGEGAFYRCENIKRVYYNGDVAGWCNISFYLSDYVYYLSQYYSSNPLYYAKEGLYLKEDDEYKIISGDIIVPDGVISVGYYLFNNCSKITSVTIPDSVTSIGKSAFYGCDYLIEIYNKSSLNITPGSSDNGYVAYYARNVYTPADGASKLTNKNGYVIYDNDILIAYTGAETEIEIPAEIKEINQYAFRNCSSLTKVIIPDSVTSIGDSAFYGCVNLTEITIPDSVTSIGSKAFYDCRSLTEITIPDSIISIADNSFGYNSLQYNEYDNGLYLGNKNNPYVVLVKAKSTDITSCIINKNTKIVYRDAFYDCSSLTEITIPDSVTSIGYGAFEYCTSLTRVTIGNSVTSIGNDAFSRCSRLTEITIPDSVTSIGSSAFYGCSSLTEITIPDSVTSIGYEAFYNCSSLTSVTIPDSVISIRDEAFFGCSSLTSVTIGSGVTSIGSSAFYGCSKLTSIYYTGTVNQWASQIDGIIYIMGSDRTLYINNEPVTNVVLEDIAEIKSYAFYNCSSLTSVTIGNSVTSIGERAFYNCRSLTEITIPDSIISIADNSFGYNSLQYNEYDNGLYLGNKNNPYVVLVKAKSTDITSCIINDKTRFIDSSAFYECRSLTEITIPDSVISIGSYAFSNCSSLVEITIPDSVISIGSYAFSNCSSLVEITIPDSVTSIGRDAFSGCSIEYAKIPIIAISYIPKGNLKTVEITSGESIGSSAFSGCSGLTEITIPDSVTSIGSSAFYGCSSLTSVTIPDSVTSIGDYAFSDCSSLTSIYYTGTVNQWNGISKGNYNVSSLKVHCIDGDVNFTR